VELWQLSMKFHCRTDDEFFIFLVLAGENTSHMISTPSLGIKSLETRTQDLAAVQLRSRESISFKLNLSAPWLTPTPMPVSMFSHLVL